MPVKSTSVQFARSLCGSDFTKRYECLLLANYSATNNNVEYQSHHPRFAPFTVGFTLRLPRERLSCHQALWYVCAVSVIFLLSSLNTTGCHVAHGKMSPIYKIVQIRKTH